MNIKNNASLQLTELQLSFLNENDFILFKYMLVCLGNQEVDKTKEGESIFPLYNIKIFGKKAIKETQEIYDKLGFYFYQKLISIDLKSYPEIQKNCVESLDEEIRLDEENVKARTIFIIRIFSPSLIVALFRLLRNKVALLNFLNCNYINERFVRIKSSHLLEEFKKLVIIKSFLFSRGELDSLQNPDFNPYIYINQSSVSSEEDLVFSSVADRIIAKLKEDFPEYASLLNSKLKKVESAVDSVLKWLNGCEVLTPQEYFLKTEKIMDALYLLFFQTFRCDSAEGTIIVSDLNQTQFDELTSLILKQQEEEIFINNSSFFIEPFKAVQYFQFPQEIGFSNRQPILSIEKIEKKLDPQLKKPSKVSSIISNIKPGSFNHSPCLLIYWEKDLEMRYTVQIKGVRSEALFEHLINFPFEEQILLINFYFFLNFFKTCTVKVLEPLSIFINQFNISDESILKFKSKENFPPFIFKDPFVDFLENWLKESYKSLQNLQVKKVTFDSKYFSAISPYISSLPETTFNTNFRAVFNPQYMVIIDFQANHERLISLRLSMSRLLDHIQSYSNGNEGLESYQKLFQYLKNGINSYSFLSSIIISPNEELNEWRKEHLRIVQNFMSNGQALFLEMTYMNENYSLLDYIQLIKGPIFTNLYSSFKEELRYVPFEDLLDTEKSIITPYDYSCFLHWVYLNKENPKILLLLDKILDKEKGEIFSSPFLNEALSYLKTQVTFFKKANPALPTVMWRENSELWFFLDDLYLDKSSKALLFLEEILILEDRLIPDQNIRFNP